MSLDQFARLKQLFLECIDLPADARDAHLTRAVEGDAELLEQGRKLLAASARAEGATDIRAGDGQVAPAAANFAIGTTIGPYKLKEQIGEGGMGIVYVAEQKKPVRRQVALKVIKPGMDSRQVIGRFEAERQALAMMDHPHIARVIDGGTTEQGRPYFVMELVRGVPITDYCDLEKLPIRERLEIFLQVCGAVQHAHQKGIIHRDLKPTNVLVSRHDDRAVAKVIDFGVAKAISQQLTEHSVYTQFSQMIGTPLYMSPEQTQISGMDVDTRSDVYSLGVMLYELLTGSTPFDKAMLQEKGIDEMRRIIREEDPAPPSSRISTLKADAGSTVSQKRSLEPRRLKQLVRGELDWIVMRAMEKDRTRRYQSASALADDVQRYLNSETVSACPPSLVYRSRKFARRNARALIAVGAVVFALLTGTGVAVWQAIDATSARALADSRFKEADKSGRTARGSGT